MASPLPNQETTGTPPSPHMAEMQIRMQNIVGRMEEMMREQGQIREFIGEH